MKSKIISVLAIAGTLALFGCDDSIPENSITNPAEEEVSENTEDSTTPDEGKAPVEKRNSLTGPETGTTPGMNSAAGDSSELGNSSSSVNGSNGTSANSQSEYSFGWAKGNAPVPTRGCGKNTQLDLKYRGDKPYIDFKWSQGTRTVRIDIPRNYNKDKPSRLVFGMQCMGGWAGGVQDEGYYGLKPLDKDETTIFVAPEGSCGPNDGQWCAPWKEFDFQLFDELLAMLEDSFCIDSSRVFSTGFSYGSMFSNSLAWNHQEVLRAVAAYETAERNIWLPNPRKRLGIGWMGVLGFDDTMCRPEMGRAARDSILITNSVDGVALREQAEEAQIGGPHKCYDYTTVEDRFPVRWCTQSGGHIWDHKDPGQKETWVSAATWDFITQF
jgi:poly(3-hydroxybutyrate) depolymerase